MELVGHGIAAQRPFCTPKFVEHDSAFPSLSHERAYGLQLAQLTPFTACCAAGQVPQRIVPAGQYRPAGTSAMPGLQVIAFIVFWSQVTALGSKLVQGVQECDMSEGGSR